MVTGGTRTGLTLPPPIAVGRSGWPWETPHSVDRIDSREDNLPTITIVTPSYNQAPYLEETIRSVLAQGYPNLEYIVVDGASRDGSETIIEHYRPWLSKAIVEPDHGQSDAINKGWRLAGGEWFGWVNSDDLLLAGALRTAGGRCAEAPSGAAVVAGGGIIVDEASRRIGQTVPHHLDGSRLVRFWNGGFAFLQAAMLFRRSDENRREDFVDASLRYVMDYDLLCRVLRTGEVLYLKELLAAFRVHGAAKSTADTVPMFLELGATSKRHWKSYGLTAGDETDFDRHVAATLTQGVLSMLRRGRLRDAGRSASYLSRCKSGDVARALLNRVLRAGADR